MGHALVQVRFNRTTNLAEDVIINTFHFSVAGEFVVTADATTIFTRVKDFYEGVGAQGSSIKNFQPLTINGTHEIRIYDMATPKPRVPFATSAFPYTTTGDALPHEVALVLTEYAAQVSGGVASRYRGRVYVGPFDNSALVSTGDAGGDDRPSANLIETLVAAGGRLMNTTTGPVWCVYSETDLALRPVVAVGCDDAWDTQRRRGSKPTSRLKLLRTAV